MIEEATELTLDDYTQLNLRLRSPKPNNQIVICYNPTSKANWVYRMFHENGVPSNTRVVHTTWKDNKFLSSEYVDSLENMAKTNPTYYKIYALGQFCTLDKLIYSTWKEEYFDVKKMIKSPDYMAIFGLDFGYTNDPSALICSFVNLKEKKIFVFDEHYEKGMLNDDVYKMIIKKGYGKEIITADSSEPKSIDELKKLGLYRIRAARKGKDSVMNGIQFIQQFEIIVHPNCVSTKMELENYTWKKDPNTNEYTNVPQDHFNHLMDAWRYSLEEIMRNMKKKVRATNKIY